MLCTRVPGEGGLNFPIEDPRTVVYKRSVFLRKLGYEVRKLVLGSCPVAGFVVSGFDFLFSYHKVGCLFRPVGR